MEKLPAWVKTKEDYFKWEQDWLAGKYEGNTNLRSNILFKSKKYLHGATFALYDFINGLNRSSITITDKKCKHCGVMISKEAKICPHCRGKQSFRVSKPALIFFLIIIGIAMLSNIFDFHRSTVTSPETTPTTTRTLTRQERIDRRFNVWDGSHINLENYIKKSMHNPDSYKHVETKYIDRGNHLVVFTVFRGTNAFGGIVTNSIMAKVGLEGDILEIVKQNNR